jgi:adenosylcobinamide-GDP ribazoletransferase
MPAAELRGLAAAIAFLTRVPVGRRIQLEAADVARGGAVFPLVGAGIGAAVGGVVQALSGPLTAPLAAVLGLAVGAVLTGALHLDALADSADALGAATRERALEIMRDHAIGA